MLKKALSYCLQEETPITIEDLIFQNKPVQKREQKYTINQAEVKVESDSSPFIKQSSVKIMIKQQSFNQQKTVQKISPYESDWQKNILNKYYNMNSIRTPTASQKNRKRTFSIQLNQKNLSYRIRGLSFQTERQSKF